MKIFSRSNSLIVLLLVAVVVGCDAPDAQFQLDTVYMRKQEKESSDFTREQKQDVADTLAAMFGTPDDPFIPTVGDTGIQQLMELDNLKMASGPVTSDRDGTPHGLYRQHCSHCHGTSGDGRGPTAAFLNPYPRDYRKGTYKFKSTPKGVRPTRDDLKRVLLNGVAGTAMPSFKLLPKGEIEALIDYVIYLGIRGEVERGLYQYMAYELDEGERFESTPDFLVDDLLATVTGKWSAASSQVTPVPPRPDWGEEETLVSIEKGRQLFYGAVANCVKCHGDTQLGDGQTDDYDDWAKDFHDWTKGRDPKLVSELVSLGGLAPRNIMPRNLRSGIYRGGRRPVDVYWRILNGIDGSPMPAALLKQDGAPATAKGLTSSDIWNLVDFVLSLPYETLDIVETHSPTYKRDTL